MPFHWLKFMDVDSAVTAESFRSDRSFLISSEPGTLEFHSKSGTKFGG